MSKQKDAEEIGSGSEPKAAAGKKEKLSRINKRHRKEARKKRRVILIVALALGAVLAVGAALDIPYINVAREAGSWVGERFAGDTEQKEPLPDYLFFTDPQSGERSEDEVSVLLGIYQTMGEDNPQRIILYLALLTYDSVAGTGEFYLIPETSVAYNAAGEQTDLKQALQEEGGEDLLRSSVGNLAGIDVDYLLLMDFWEAVGLAQGLGMPPVVLPDKTVLVNPVNGETNYLVAGQKIGDADRLLFYLMATDELEMWEAFSDRLERAREYIPEALSALEQEDPDNPEQTTYRLGEGYLLDPGTGSAEGDSAYLASMLRAFAELQAGELTIKAAPAVEVLNGCGDPDLGKKVGDRLTTLGVPVAGTGGNAKVTVEGEEINDFSHTESTIICRSEDPRVVAFASYLGVLLSIDDIKYEPGPGPEIILIAGKDLAG